MRPEVVDDGRLWGAGEDDEVLASVWLEALKLPNDSRKIVICRNDPPADDSNVLPA